VETARGSIVGTFEYMAPEQAEGSAVDHRSDIFSFGALLYEMLSGQRVFQRGTAVATLSAILRDDPPPLRTVVKNAPYDLERIVTRCLRKDPAYRFQHMDDVHVALREVRDQIEPGSASPVAVYTAKHRRVWWISAVAVVMILGALGLWRTLSTQPTLQAVEL